MPSRAEDEREEKESFKAYWNLGAARKNKIYVIETFKWEREREKNK